LISINYLMFICECGAQVAPHHFRMHTHSCEAMNWWFLGLDIAM